MTLRAATFLQAMTSEFLVYHLAGRANRMEGRLAAVLRRRRELGETYSLCDRWPFEVRVAAPAIDNVLVSCDGRQVDHVAGTLSECEVETWLSNLMRGQTWTEALVVAISTSPFDSVTQIALALMFAKVGRYEEAIDSYRRAWRYAVEDGNAPMLLSGLGTFLPSTHAKTRLLDQFRQSLTGQRPSDVALSKLLDILD